MILSPKKAGPDRIPSERLIKYQLNAIQGASTKVNSFKLKLLTNYCIDLTALLIFVQL